MVKEGFPAQALQERVYGQLKDRIINCDMLPGDVISEDQYAGEFGTSRTPIREALLRLQRENLVVIFPRQGTFVSQISLQDIYEIYQIRLIMEPRVARIAVRGGIDEEKLGRFRDLFAHVDLASCGFKEWFQHDRDFHGFIIHSSHNKHLIGMYESIMDQSQRMRILAGRLPSRIDSTNNEHIGVVDALFTKDEELIEKTMTSHIIASRDAALRIEGFLHD